MVVGKFKRFLDKCKNVAKSILKPIVNAAPAIGAFVGSKVPVIGTAIGGAIGSAVKTVGTKFGL